MITLTDQDPITRRRGDSLNLLFRVTDISADTDAPLNLTGATITAALSVGGQVFEAITGIVNSSAGEASATWAPGEITTAGDGVVQIRINRIGQSEVVKTHRVVIGTAIV